MWHLGTRSQRYPLMYETRWSAWLHLGIAPCSFQVPKALLPTPPCYSFGLFPWAKAFQMSKHTKYTLGTCWEHGCLIKDAFPSHSMLICIGARPKKWPKSLLEGTVWPWWNLWRTRPLPLAPPTSSLKVWVPHMMGMDFDHKGHVEILRHALVGRKFWRF